MHHQNRSNHALLRRAAHLAPILFLVAAAWALAREIGAIESAHLWTALKAISPVQWFAGLLLTVGGYAVMTLYDVIGLRLLGAALPYKAAAEGALTSFAVSHNVGLGWLSGGSMRQRTYGPLGLSLADVARLTILNSVTFFIGGFAVAGAALIGKPEVMTDLLPVSQLAVRLCGVGLWIGLAGYFLMCGVRRAPLGWRGMSLPVPRLPAALAQVAIATADILIAGSVLYVLLPHQVDIELPILLGAYVVALAAAVLTHVPGGLGVFETAILWSLPTVPRAPLLAGLLAYRIVYYLVPLAIALIWTCRHALPRSLERSVRTARRLGGAIPLLATGGSVASGFFLLLSGATPALDAHVNILKRIVPLPLLELSHLAGSIAGLGLVLLGGALYRRYETARNAAILLLLAGAAISLLQHRPLAGALALTAAAATLEASASAFYRRGGFWRNAVTPGWIAIGLLALGGSVWIGFRAYADIGYTHELWWQFAYDAGAPRFLRASLVAGIVGFAMLSARLLGPARHRQPPDPVDASVRDIVAAAPETEANLALVGDKSFLFSRSGRSLLMYRVEGRSWIAMGDPVGPRAEWPELMWRFLERADNAGGRAVFYEASGERLDLYADAGLVAHKIGEDARVDLRAFDLSSPGSKPFRAALSRGERGGLRFAIVTADALPAILDELDAVSREWLKTKGGPEKGFSLGAFDPDYLRQFDCAVVHHEGRIVAFANLWLGARLSELSMDLMRHRAAVPRGTMTFLLLNLILWAKRSGFQWFNLGMAPLAGLARHRLAPRWHGIGRIIAAHGERLYGFQGLRGFKAQFHPVWRSRYIVCRPGTLTLALAMFDCVRLISRAPERLQKRNASATRCRVSGDGDSRGRETGTSSHPLVRSWAAGGRG